MIELLKTFFWPRDITSWIFFVLIGSIFWIALVITTLQFRRRKNQIVFLQECISSIRRVETQEDVFRLEKSLVNIPIAALPWEEFKGTFVWREDHVFSRETFHEFFNLDTFKPHPILSPRVVASIPSTLTVLGILGTFVSLVLGLKGLNIEDTSRLQQGVGVLIGSINTAYLKSIWGVGGSVVFLFIDRMLSDQLRWLVERAATRFDHLFTPLSSEGLLVQILSEQQQQTHALKAFSTDLSNTIRQTSSNVEGHLESHTSILENFGTDLSTSIHSALSGSIEEHLAPFMSRMESQVSDVATAGGENQERALEAIVDIFREKMIGAMQDGMNELTTSLQGVAGRMEKFGESAAVLTAEMKKVTGDLSETQRDLGGTLEMVDQTLEALATATTQAHETANMSRGIIESSANQQKSSADILKQFDAIAAGVGATVAALERCQTGIDATASSIGGSINTLDHRWSDFANRFETVNTTLRQTAVEFAQQVRTEVEQYCITLDSNLASASSSLNSAVVELEEGLMGLEKSVARMHPEEKLMDEVSSTFALLQAWKKAHEAHDLSVAKLADQPELAVNTAGTTNGKGTP